jgi:hypothetical protein
MKLAWNKAVRTVGTTAVLTAALLTGACQSFGPRRDCRDCDECECGTKAHVCKDPTVRALAQDVDELDRHLDRFGSVVASQPSVWGQARLTRHREEFEQQMALELGNFHATLQGSLSRSDQAYFANAMSLGVAVSGPSAVATPPKVLVNNNTAANSGTAIPVPNVDLPQAFGAFDKITRTDTKLTNIGFADIAKGGLTLEPAVYLDQKARYLNHLQELRRINEGDDTADSPGYSLNLVRIPVSVLPGKETDRGYGGEITFTLTPYLSDELLPTTFRNLILNDLVDQIGVPLTELLNDSEVRKYLLLDQYENQAADKKQMRPALRDKAIKLKETHDVNKIQTAVRSRLQQMPPSVSATRLKHAKRPFPASQLLDVYGDELSLHVARTAYAVFDDDLPNTYYVHYPDVQGYLQEELDAAYKFLALPGNAALWQLCSPDLVVAVRGRNLEGIKTYRKAFEEACGNTNCPNVCDTTKALAWAIIVECALLNEQLVQDMREAAALRGCCNAQAGWQPYYLPNPPPEARQAFNDYVRCRWPIHVFALDPVNQEQNIADTFSARREMQLAMSLAFVSGQLSAKNMMRYARRLESEIETIALNSTSVGFSHGNEIFGWRFYPRFQTPDIESNATVFFRDLLIGGPNRDDLLRQRRMEPGQRECVAIVIMPSFVPYCTLDSTSNWFPLDRCHQKVLTAKDAIRLGERVKSIQNCAGHVGDAQCYRDGDLCRLLKRAEQLEARLPMQTASVQVPYENTLGGFAMFNTGITDLAPELLGWYGSPGINLDAPTTIFLIGNHFSVHQTRVLVGGKEVTSMEMLSRQVMKVTIPAGTLAITGETGRIAACMKPPAAKPPDVSCDKLLPLAIMASQAAGLGSTGDPFGTAAVLATGTAEYLRKHPPACPAPAGGMVEGDENLFVDVHVATPYGVTSHLLIPACPAGKGGAGAATGAAVPGASWATDKLELGFVYQGLGVAAANPPVFRPLAVKIDLSDLPRLPTVSVTLNCTVNGPGGAKTKLSGTINAKNLDVTNHTLVLKDDDLVSLVNQIFAAVGPLFGPEATNPPVPVTLSDAKVVILNGTTVLLSRDLTNTLTIAWVKAPGKMAPPAT